MTRRPLDRRAQTWRSIRAVRRARREASVQFYGGAVLMLGAALLAVRSRSWPEACGAVALLVLWAVTCRASERHEGLR